jgi:hypothetical protein
VFYLAEFYLPAGSALGSVAQRARAAAEQAASTGIDIAFVAAIFLSRDEICFVLYRAARAGDVTTAGSLAGLAFERVTGAEISRAPSPWPAR